MSHDYVASCNRFCEHSVLVDHHDDILIFFQQTVSKSKIVNQYVFVSSIFQNQWPILVQHVAAGCRFVSIRYNNIFCWIRCSPCAVIRTHYAKSHNFVAVGGGLSSQGIFSGAWVVLQSVFGSYMRRVPTINVFRKASPFLSTMNLGFLFSTWQQPAGSWRLCALVFEMHKMSARFLAPLFCLS